MKVLSKRWLLGVATLAIAGIAAAVGTQAFAGSAGRRGGGCRRRAGVRRASRDGDLPQRQHRFICAADRRTALPVKFDFVRVLYSRTI